MSKASSRSNFWMRGRSHTESETRAIDPAAGTGTGLPIGIKLVLVMPSGLEQGAITLTVWPQPSNCAARLRMCSLAPPRKA